MRKKRKTVQLRQPWKILVASSSDRRQKKTCDHFRSWLTIFKTKQQTTPTTMSVQTTTMSYAAAMEEARRLIGDEQFEEACAVIRRRGFEDQIIQAMREGNVLELPKDYYAASVLIVFVCCQSGQIAADSNDWTISRVMTETIHALRTSAFTAAAAI
jgi:hypothetical protein